MGSCFMVTWTIFKNHFLKIGLTQNWGDRGTRNLATYFCFVFCMYEGPAWTEKSLKYHLAEGRVTYDFTLHLRGLWPQEVSWDNPWTLIVGSHNFMVTRPFWALSLVVRKCLGTAVGRFFFRVLQISRSRFLWALSLVYEVALSHYYMMS